MATPEPDHLGRRTRRGDRTAALVREEFETLHNYLKALSPADWQHETACAEWDVSEVVAHLARGAQLYTDWITRGLAGDSSTPEGAWEAGSVGGAEAAPSVAESAQAYRASLGHTVLATFRENTADLLDLFDGLDAQDWEKPCYHPGAIYPARTFLSLRMMELSLHGWDIRSRLEPPAQLSPASVRIIVELIPDFLGWLFSPTDQLLKPVRFRFRLSGAVEGFRDIVVLGDQAVVETEGSLAADLDFRADAQNFVLLLFGRLIFKDAIAAGQMKVSGDRGRCRQFAQWFAGA